MTKPFLQNLNEIHKQLWQKSNEGQIKGDEIKKTIKKVAGYTVVDKYWDELHNFDRIEQVPETETWIVEKPETHDISRQEHTGEKKAKQVMIPEELLEAGKQYGVNFSRLMTNAIVEEITNIEDFVTEYLEEDFTETETEYIFELFKNNLEMIEGRQKKQARRDKRRRELYKETFGVVKSDRQHIEELRKKSAKLREMF